MLIATSKDKKIVIQSMENNYIGSYKNILSDFTKE